ncbi:hypothetical protein FGO68_gene3634 [Halteria grandinella]|uniref:Uncharacterized protein n=1 Tax=Halteria grandinella TaxID=5974 RepID=A0A8J8NR22_HALGN|nr:hypothetical protein FGO68_gene3634 [Halteria grandinella]
MRFIRSKNQLNEHINLSNQSALLSIIKDEQNSLIFVRKDTLVGKLFSSPFFTSRIQCRWKQNSSNDLHKCLFSNCQLKRLIMI